MKGAWQKIRAFFTGVWRRFLSFSRRTQIIIGVVILLILAGLVVWARSGSNTSEPTSEPTVILQSIGSFGNNGNGVDVIGTVQSVSEADILAQSAGTVEAVNTTIGANVPAGFVIASLDGSAASASVLQAQGAYDAAVAAAKATTLQAQNTTESLPVAKAAADNTYQTAYTGAESALIEEVDQLFGNNTPVGPALLISPLYSGDEFPRERAAIKLMMTTWSNSLATDSTADPITLLDTAQSNLATIANFITALTALADTQDSGASTAQIAALGTAASTINSLQASVTAAITTYNAASTAASVSQTQSSESTNSGVTSAQASVEEALGALRAAQAAYQKTLITAPIAGTVDFLPINVGDFASQNEHVATVARNNALQVKMELSQEDANLLAVGDTVTINNTDRGIVTTIAPALDPTTQQIEVDVAVNDGSDLVDGESVQVVLPSLASEAPDGSGSTTPSKATASTTASTTPTIELPLTAVKLLPNERDVFSVDSTGHLVAHPVQIGQVIGDDIQILTPLDPSLLIVTDARGLSAGDAVLVSSSTPGTSD